MVYADTSFFVSTYLADAHSAAAEELASSGDPIWYTPLHHAEWMHAVAQHVFFKKIAASDAERIYRHMQEDRIKGTWKERPIPAGAFELCADLARLRGAKFGMRTLDTLHVACALELKTERFWTFDERQAKLAKAQGMKVS